MIAAESAILLTLDIARSPSSVPSIPMSMAQAYGQGPLRTRKKYKIFGLRLLLRSHGELCCLLFVCAAGAVTRYPLRHNETVRRPRLGQPLFVTW